jgi:UDP-N-acetylglucosamine transferase subunit ALG13
MIFATVGTHEIPFDRFVRAVDKIGLTFDERVVIQRGYSLVPAPHCEVHGLLSPNQVQQYMSEARIVICHAGPATILEVQSTGKVPIVVPRRAEFGEHIDDHQVAFAKRIADQVHLVNHTTGLIDSLRCQDEVSIARSPATPSKRNADAVSEGLGQLIDEVLSGHAPPRSKLRDTFSVLTRIGFKRQ